MPESTECEDCGLEYDSEFIEAHKHFCGMGPVTIDNEEGDSEDGA